ncbi:MAG: hypothetical protein ACOC55_00940 [Candidatus Natronoplasma sp.]
MKQKIHTMLVAWLAAILILSVFGLAISGVSSASEDDGEEIDQGPPFDPPVEDGEAYRNRSENAAANGSATFLQVEDYQPWAALVINAGDPAGVDAVTVSFEDDTLIIEATDSNDTNHVTILVNRAFADEHLADSEGDLDIETSDAVNYDGLDNSNASAGGGGMYVFQVESFSTETIEISAADNLPFLSFPLLMISMAVTVAIYALKNKN